MPKRHERGGGFLEHTEPMPRAAHAPPLPVLLRVLRGEPGSVASAHRLSAGSCLVGTSPGAHLRLSAPTVSRQHCEVELRNDGVLVSDLGSKNGTYYLGRRVESILLSAGSSFAVGEVEIGVEVDLPDRQLAPSKSTHFHGLDGESVAMRRLFSLLERLARARVPALIEGESGSGKLLCARALHLASEDPSTPYLVVSCATRPTPALALALFGDDAHPGALTRAAFGTLVLRDVDALPMELQPSLLARLESPVRELDTSSGRPSDSPRLLLTCSSSLAEAAGAGRFHAGLYYRLGLLRIEVPPLRDRREDIPAIASSMARELGGTLSAETLAELQRRPWPGNLRELRSALAVHAALGVLPMATSGRGELLDVALDALADPSAPYADQKDRLVERFTSIYLHRLLAHAGGNQTTAARLAGLDRGYLGKMLTRHGLKPND